MLRALRPRRHPRRGHRRCGHAYVTWLALVLVLVAASTSGRAYAQAVGALSGVALAWSTPAGSACPAHDQILQMVRDLLGQSASTPKDLRVTARVSARPDDGYHLAFEMRGADGASHRELDAESCLAAADATALLIALAIDPRAGASEPRATPEPTRDTTTRPPALHLVTGLGVVLDPVLLPALTMGLVLQTIVGYGPLRVALSGAYLPPQSRVFTTGRVDFEAFDLDARGCFAFELGIAALAPCAGARIAFIDADAIDLPQLRDASAYAFFAGGGALLQIKIVESFQLWLATDLDFGVRRPRFAVETGPRTFDIVYQPRLLDLRTSAGIAISLP